VNVFVKYTIIVLSSISIMVVGRSEGSRVVGVADIVAGAVLMVVGE